MVDEATGDEDKQGSLSFVGSILPKAVTAAVTDVLKTGILALVALVGTGLLAAGFSPSRIVRLLSGFWMWSTQPWPLPAVVVVLGAAGILVVGILIGRRETQHADSSSDDIRVTIEDSLYCGVAPYSDNLPVTALLLLV